jgi:hypothetical protein
LDTKLKKVFAFVLLGLALVAVAFGTHTLLEATWEEVEVPTHSIRSHSLGLHQQGDDVRARVVIDEGSVKVLEGRFAIVQLVDSDNRASMEQGEGYVPVAEARIDVKERSFPLLGMNEGRIEYTAHRTDTYYLVYRNEDWWELKLQVADGDAIDHQFAIKVFATALFIAVLVIFPWAYGRAFDVNVRHRLGLVRRLKGPGSASAQEPRGPDVPVEEMVLEAEE